MLKNRTSPKKPLLAAFGAACISLLFAFGYRGKYQPSAAMATFEEGARLFIMVLAASFIVFYPLRMLGVHFGPMGGPEKDCESTPKRDAKLK